MSHEQVYVQDIVKAATDAAKGAQIESVKIVVGELAPILATDLRHALAFTHWQLDIVEKPGTIQCPCGFVGRPTIHEKGHDYTVYSCPKCKEDLPPIIDGKDVVLKDVTVL